MKKRLLAILLFLFTFFSVIAYCDQITNKKSTSTDADTILIPKNYCYQLTYTSDSVDANEDLVWESSNKKIATVDQNGIITGIKQGECIISVYTGNGKKAQYKISVKKYDAVLCMTDTKVKVDFKTKGESSRSRVQFGNRVLESSSEIKVTFMSRCVKSEEAYTLTPVKPGEDTVTVTRIEKQNGKKTETKETYSVLVSRNPLWHKDEQRALQEDTIVPLDMPASKISFEETSIHLAPKTTWRLNLTAEPKGALIQDIVWTSSDERVVMVNNDGIVTAISKGSAKITATAQHGRGPTATINVKVKNYDLVFQDRTTQTVQYSYGSGQSYISGSVKNGNVSIPDINGYITATIIGGTGKAERNVEVTPLKTGEDIITIKVNDEKYTFSVYVSQEAFKIADSAPINEGESIALLEFDSVTGMNTADMRKVDGVYELHTLQTKDPETDSNTLRFHLKDTVDFSKSSFLSFYIKDLQGNNTHKVTIIDKNGNISSRWIDIRSIYGEWIRIDAPLRDFSGEIDLKEVTEIRIGEWNKGSYLFDRIGLR